MRFGVRCQVRWFVFQIQCGIDKPKSFTKDPTDRKTRWIGVAAGLLRVGTPKEEVRALVLVQTQSDTDRPRNPRDVDKI